MTNKQKKQIDVMFGEIEYSDTADLVEAYIIRHIESKLIEAGHDIIRSECWSKVVYYDKQGNTIILKANKDHLQALLDAAKAVLCKV